MSFVASDKTRDSYGTVLMPDGWRLDRFNSNPVIGYMHNLQYASDPDAVIGKGRAYIDSDRLMIDVEFEPEGMNPKADKVWQKLEFGTLNAVSVGFVPVAGRWGEGPEGPNQKEETYYYTDMELLEVSVVTIPANPNALKNADDPESDRLASLRQEAVRAEQDALKTKDGLPDAARTAMENDIAMAETELLLINP